MGLRSTLGARAITVAALLLFAASASAQQGWIPPEVLLIDNLSCKIAATPLGWRVEAVASYANAQHHNNGEPWRLVIALVREKNERKSRRSANEVCTDWMLAVKKKQKENENEKVPIVRIDPVIFTWR